mmetsp:Transcript_6779/g.18962  ORF Transcript_6779/g.18962 Transcript_6779/m.18962 type:complete len:163 (-) Transcript_6779:311-799(-)
MPRKNRSRVSLRVGVEQSISALYQLPAGQRVNDMHVNNLLEFVFEEFARTGDGVDVGASSKRRFWQLVERKEKEKEKPRSKEAIWQANYRAKKKQRVQGPGVPLGAITDPKDDSPLDAAGIAPPPPPSMRLASDEDIKTEIDKANRSLARPASVPPQDVQTI